MKILFVASEAAPFARTGGLAEVAGSLPQALAALGHDVRLVMPRYRAVDRERHQLREAGVLSVPLASWKERCEILETRLGHDVPAYFVNKDVYYDRPGLYGTAQGDFRDNAERFIFFSRAVPELCLTLGFAPDIIHGNDWQTGLVPVYLKTLYRDAGPLRDTASVFTIHNLGYQGIFWHWDMHLTGLGWDVFTPEGIEFWGNMNLLKAGIVYADAVTTVSKTYAREIQTPAYGHGLEGVLTRRAKDLFGIVNGIDYREWDPERDPVIARNYSPDRMAGKAACKRTLRASLGLRDSRRPLLGMVARLTDQKGLDILVDALPRIMAHGVQLVILGAGEERYHRALTAISGNYPDQMRVALAYDDLLAKRIYAGCDIFLMPSRYEPCGLGQMNALRYGAVPVVRKTGGLADTVAPYSTRTGRGTGFLFTEYTARALADGVSRAVALYADRQAWKGLVKNGMERDFSWTHSAQEYVKVYRRVMKK